MDIIYKKTRLIDEKFIFQFTDIIPMFAVIIKAFTQIIKSF